MEKTTGGLTLVAWLGDGTCLECANCGKPGATIETCPYAEEINDDPEHCRCCEDCREQCAMDI